MNCENLDQFGTSPSQQKTIFMCKVTSTWQRFNTPLKGDELPHWTLADADLLHPEFDQKYKGSR